MTETDRFTTIIANVNRSVYLGFQRLYRSADMSRIEKITLQNAQGKAKELLTSAKESMGAEINLIGVFANAPAALEGYLSFNTALSHGALDPIVREKLAVAIAGYNHCDYCASAHTFIGGKQGISKEELTSNLTGSSKDSKSAAALTFAVQLIEKRGQVTDSEIQSVRDAGYSNEEIIEILSHVALNTFTNYFNVAFKTDVDFPLVNT